MEKAGVRICVWSGKKASRATAHIISAFHGNDHVIGSVKSYDLLKDISHLRYTCASCGISRRSGSSCWSGRPSSARGSGGPGRPGNTCRPSRSGYPLGPGRGDDKRKVAINPQTMGNYKKIKSITLRMEPSGTTWAAFLRGQAGKEEIY